MNKSPGFMIAARDFQEKKLTFEHDGELWIYNTDARDEGREEQRFMKDWEPVIGKQAKDNVRGKMVVSITKIFYDKEDPGVINVIQMNQIDTGASSVGGFFVKQALPKSLISWRNNLQAYMEKNFEK